MPTTKPMAMPIIIRLNVDKLKHWRKPETNACNMSMTIETLQQSTAECSPLNISAWR